MIVNANAIVAAASVAHSSAGSWLVAGLSIVSALVAAVVAFATTRTVRVARKSESIANEARKTLFEQSVRDLESQSWARYRPTLRLDTEPERLHAKAQLTPEQEFDLLQRVAQAEAERSQPKQDKEPGTSDDAA